MVSVTNEPDPQWTAAGSLMRSDHVVGASTVGLLGAHTYRTSLTPRSSTSTPRAIRQALARFSTWSYVLGADLLDHVRVVDLGDVEEPDGEDGFSRVATAIEGFDAETELRIFLGGDNALTWHAMRAVAGRDLATHGLVTLDAHLDMRDGVSNGSPVRQLLGARTRRSSRRPGGPGGLLQLRRTTRAGRATRASR